jgi:hypothetical protein
MQPRILVASNYNDGMALFNALSFDFCRVAGETSGADIVAPDEIVRGKIGEAMATLVMKGSRALGMTRPTLLKPVTIESDYDLFFYVCMSPKHLADLKAIRGWRERSGKAAVFIFETWSKWLSRDRAHLKMLDAFDHVFLFNKASIPNVQAYTSSPCSFLAAGADCLSATPFPHNPARTIDVYSMGRRSEPTHRQLIAMARNSEIFYLFDPGSGLRVYDFAQARLLTLNNIKRCRYFVAYSLSVGTKALESAGEEALPARIFEGAAGGAAMIGTAPRCPEFHEYFDWPDAIIEIPVEPDDIRSILKDLDSDVERLDQVRFRNAMQSLRRHDWVYRWEHVLTTLGFDIPRGVAERRSALLSLADAAEADEHRRRMTRMAAPA